MTSVKKTLVYEMLTTNSYRADRAAPSKTAVVELPQFRKLPEGFRKGYGKGSGAVAVSLQFRKRPEGFRKGYGKVNWRSHFTAVPEGPGRFPEGLREGENATVRANIADTLLRMLRACSSCGV